MICLKYRQLQVLCLYLNKLQADSLMNVFTAMLCWGHILCLYFLVQQSRSEDKVNVVACILFALASINAIFIIVVAFKIAAQVYVRSVEGKHYFETKIFKRLQDSGINLENWKEIQRRRMFIRRQVKSWSHIKIMFFSANYFESKTPLKLEEFCISQTVSLLVMEV